MSSEVSDAALNLLHSGNQGLKIRLDIRGFRQLNPLMIQKLPGLMALLAICICSMVGCYPVYPPPGSDFASNVDSKGYSVPAEPLPPGPRYVGVDPGLVIAGVAAAGLLGYAIAGHHGHHGVYYGPGYYAPRCYY